MQLNGIASHILYLKYQPRSEIYSISFSKKCHLKQHFTVNNNISVLCLEILGLFCYYWIVFYQMKKNNNNNNMVIGHWKTHIGQSQICDRFLNMYIFSENWWAWDSMSQCHKHGGTDKFIVGFLSFCEIC